MNGAHGEGSLYVANLILINHLAVELRDTIKNQDSSTFRKHFGALKMVPNQAAPKSFKLRVFKTTVNRIQ